MMVIKPLDMEKQLPQKHEHVIRHAPQLLPTHVLHFGLGSSVQGLWWCTLSHVTWSSCPINPSTSPGMPATVPFPAALWGLSAHPADVENQLPQEHEHVVRHGRHFPVPMCFVGRLFSSS